MLRSTRPWATCALRQTHDRRSPLRLLVHGVVRPARDGNGGYRLQRGNLDLRGDMGDRHGTNGTGNGTVSGVALVGTIIGGKRQAVAPIACAVADVGNRVSNGQHVRDSADNHELDHNDIEEVIHSNNERHEHPVNLGRLEQPVNRR